MNKFELVCKCYSIFVSFNPIALRKAKIVCNFGLSECNRVKGSPVKEKRVHMSHSIRAFDIG